MGYHIFGKRHNGGELGRFRRTFSDAAFEQLVQGRPLPRWWVAWHLEDGESVQNSERVRQIVALPLWTGALLGNPADPEPDLIGAWARGEGP